MPRITVAASSSSSLQTQALCWIFPFHFGSFRPKRQALKRCIMAEKTLYLWLPNQTGSHPSGLLPVKGHVHVHESIGHSTRQFPEPHARIYSSRRDNQHKWHSRDWIQEKWYLLQDHLLNLEGVTILSRGLRVCCIASIFGSTACNNSANGGFRIACALHKNMGKLLGILCNLASACELRIAKSLFHLTFNSCRKWHILLWYLC